MTLRETLHTMAEDATPVAVPDGLFDRARRRHRRRQRFTAATAAVAVLAIGYALSPVSVLPAEPAAGPAGLPDVVHAPPRWTELYRSSPNGPASVVFTGDGLPDPAFSTDFVTPVAVVGLTRDTYRILYASQGDVALSPDGRTLLVAHQAPNSPDMSSKYWRTDAVDLATGQARTLIAGAEPVSWSTDGTHVVVVRPDRWDHPDAPAATINDVTASVLDWPSGHVEWSVHMERPDTVEGESTFLFALSPDATKLAVSTSRELRVYRSDGSVAWDHVVGWTSVAGPAAWRDDTHLAVFARDLPPAGNFYDPSRWTLSYVDPATGEPVAAQGYPVISSMFDVSVVGWRADTAYAVARSDRNNRTQAQLLRLVPGRSAGVPVLQTPADVNGLSVAVDYLDTVRPAGDPAYGVEWRQVLAIALMVLEWMVLAGVVLAVGWAWWRGRRYRRLRSIPPAP